MFDWVINTPLNELTKLIHTRKSEITGIHSAYYQIAPSPLIIEQ